MPLLKIPFFMMLLTLAFALPSQAVTEAPPLKVGVMMDHSPISSMDSGTPQGLAFLIWDVIANYYNWQYTIVPISKSQLEDSHPLVKGEIDVLLGPITPSSNTMYDTSHGYFLSTFGVAIKSKPMGFWASFINSFQDGLLEITLLSLVLWFLLPIWVWALERKESPRVLMPFSKGYFTIVWSFFLALTSISIDYMPKRSSTRWLHVFWILLGFIFMTGFGGVLSSAFTMSHMSRDYRSLEDVAHKTYAIDGSTISKESINFLKQTYKIKPLVTSSLSQAFQTLREGKAHGVIGEQAFLNQHIRHHRKYKEFHISHLALNSSLFTTAFPLNSPLMSKFNDRLLWLQSQGMNILLCRKVFGYSDQQQCII